MSDMPVSWPPAILTAMEPVMVPRQYEPAQPTPSASTRPDAAQPGRREGELYGRRTLGDVGLEVLGLSALEAVHRLLEARRGRAVAVGLVLDAQDDVPGGPAAPPR
jgi:hypothetical protein